MEEQLEMDYGADSGAARERIKELEKEVARLTDADNESVRVMMAATDEVDRLSLVLARREKQIKELEARLEELKRRNDTQAESITYLQWRVDQPSKGSHGPT